MRIPSAFFLGVCTYLLFMKLSFILIFPHDASRPGGRKRQT